MFEDYLEAVTSHLKDDYSHSSSFSRTSSTEESTFSSLLRIDSVIKDTSMILNKKIDEMLHLSSKTSAKFFENESNDKNFKLSLHLTSKHVTFEPFNLDCLEDPSALDHFKEHPFFYHSEKAILEEKVNETLDLKSNRRTEKLNLHSI